MRITARTEYGLAVVKQFMEGAADGPVPFHYPAPDYREQLIGQERRA